MKYFALIMMLITTITVSAVNKKENKERVRFAIELHCQSCVRKIEKNIPYEKGITDLVVNFKEQWVEVEYRTDKTSKANLQVAFKKLDKETLEIPIK